METLRKTQKEMLESKKIVECLWFISRLDAAREKIIIGELEDMSIETSQTEMQREWKEKEINTEYLRALG